MITENRSGYPPCSSYSQNSRKILTPMAKLAAPRVEAEIISRGSAAIIMDRVREASIGICDTTPEQFAVMRRIVANDTAVIVNSVAEFSPANATLCSPTSDQQTVETRGALLTPRMMFADSPRLGFEGDRSVGIHEGGELRSHGIAYVGE